MEIGETDKLIIPVKIMTQSDVSDHVTGLMNYVDQDEQRSIEIFRSKSPAQMAELLLQNPPKILLDDDTEYTPHIVHPSRADRNAAEKLTRGTYDPLSPGHRLAEIGSYLLLPQIPVDDPYFDSWKDNLTYVLQEMDFKLGLVDPEQTYSHAFKKALLKNQFDPRESVKVLDHYEALRNHISWSSETNQLAAKLGNIFTDNPDLLKIKSPLLAQETRPLVIAISRLMYEVSSIQRRISRHEVDHLTIGETLDSLLTHIANAQRMGKPIIKKEDLRGHGQACLEKISKFAVASPTALIDQINQTPPTVKVLVSKKERKKAGDESIAMSEYKELRPDLKTTPPTKAEKEAATIIQNNRFNQNEKNAMAPIAAFLETPRVDDGFGSDHASRTTWEVSVAGALTLITADAKRRLSKAEAEKFPHLDELFNGMVTQTKYSKNSRMKVYNGLSLLLGTLGEVDGRRVLIQSLMDEFIQKNYKETYLDQDKDKEDQEFDADKVADDVSWIAQRALYIMNFDYPPQNNGGK